MSTAKNKKQKVGKICLGLCEMVLVFSYMIVFGIIIDNVRSASPTVSVCT